MITRRAGPCTDHQPITPQTYLSYHIIHNNNFNGYCCFSDVSVMALIVFIQAITGKHFWKNKNKNSLSSNYFNWNKWITVQWQQKMNINIPLFFLIIVIFPDWLSFDSFFQMRIRGELQPSALSCYKATTICYYWELPAEGFNWISVNRSVNWSARHISFQNINSSNSGP